MSDPRDYIRRAAQMMAGTDMDLREARAAFNRAYVRAALLRANGRRGEAAAALQIDPTTLNRILAGGSCKAPT